MSSPLTVDSSRYRSVAEVLAELLGQVRRTGLTEPRPLVMAHGCYLARDVIAPINVPPAANSAMDGYAIDRRATTAGAWFPISDRIPAGHPGKPLTPGTAARIFTGAELPQGADTVVIQEATETGADRVSFTRLPAPGANVRPMGQDIARGDVILQSGDRLNPARLGLLASVGIPEVPVFTPLKVALMATGDELVQPGDQAGPGQIYNSSRILLGGILTAMGMAVIDLGIVRDTPAETEASLLAAADQADCILATGGVSVGEEDHVKTSVEKLGRIDIWKLAIKPGKPLACGHVRSTRNQGGSAGGEATSASGEVTSAGGDEISASGEVTKVPFFGLPGNPVSTFVTFMMLARPCLIAMQGGREPHNKICFGTSGFHRKAGGRREYVRVRTTATSDGKVQLELFPNQGSGVLTSVAWADALAEIAPNQQVTPGDLLKFYPF